jgi:hypothetical protein
MPRIKKKHGGVRKNAGKPRGTKHKKTLQWEEFGKQLLDNGLPRAMRILNRTSNERFMSYFLKLLEYFKPRAQRIELTNENPISIFLNMTAAQRSEYIKNLKSQSEHGTSE